MIATPKLPIVRNSQFSSVEDRLHEPVEPAPVDRLLERRAELIRIAVEQLHLLGAGEQTRDCRSRPGPDGRSCAAAVIIGLVAVARAGMAEARR